MYIDAFLNRKTEEIYVSERAAGQRVLHTYKPDYHFFIEDPRGTHKSIYGTTVKKIVPKTSDERMKLSRMMQGRKFESDMNLVNRCLEQNYQNTGLPDPHVAFFDIETDFHALKGYAPPENPFNPITSIAVYLQWMKQMVCLAVPPRGMSMSDAEQIALEVGNVMLFDNEKDMLDVFMTLIEDADIVSGWNSCFFDIPYVAGRIIRLFGKQELRRLCLWDQMPISRTVERGGKECATFDLVGRIHLDYLDLYKKYNYEEKSSYALDSIAEAELGERKVQYNGTLDQLYNNDFKKFLEYNIQDTMLLDRLDRKLRYVFIANTMAHNTCVLLPATLGTVAVTDNALVMEAHSQNLVVPDKGRHDDTQAAGGWVAKPRRGLHKMIGSTDLNSLYPSVLRALNMSIETIIGQVDLSQTKTAISDWCKAAKKNKFATWWNDRFEPLEMQNFINNDNYHRLNLKFEDGEVVEITGAELRKLVFDSGQPWCISANGTIFRTDKEGLIPSLLTRKYAERKRKQGIEKTFVEIIKGTNTVEFNDFSNNKLPKYENVYEYKKSDLLQAISLGEESLHEYLINWGLEIVNRSIVCNAASKSLWDEGEIYWNKLQTVDKLFLNGSYGAFLNPGCRFFDQRIGQSTTLTGRNITRHMAAKTNEMITGTYDHAGKCVIYGDTDSCYFSAYPELKDDIESGKITMTKEDYINLYDTIGDQVSDTFPEFLHKTFNVPIKRSTGVIKAGREVVASTGLFIKKKRYAAMVFDKDGFREDTNGKPGKVKAMGLDLRRSDTPKFIQAFLKDVLYKTLTGSEEAEVLDFIKEFRDEFTKLEPWKKGSPKAANKISSYQEKEEAALAKRLKGEAAKVNIPGHVRGAMNWNHLRSINNDRVTMPIVDGQKVIVCKLKTTANNFMNCIAYPVDEPRLPTWFTELPFDEDEMENVLIDKKLSNLLGVLKWDLESTSKNGQMFDSLFDMGAIAEEVDDDDEEDEELAEDDDDL